MRSGPSWAGCKHFPELANSRYPSPRTPIYLHRWPLPDGTSAGTSI